MRDFEISRMTGTSTSLKMSNTIGQTVLREGVLSQDSFVEGTKFLDQPFSKTGIWTYVRAYFTITLQALFIGGFYVLHSTTISAGVYFANQSGSPAVQAAFGTAQFINGFFTEYLCLAIVESSTVLAAEYLGSHDYIKAKRTFFQGFFLNALFYVAVFVPFYFWAEAFFISTGFGSTDAQLSASYYRKLFWIYLLSNTTAHLFGLGTSQGYLKELIAATVCHWLVAYGLIYYFCVFRDMGLDGWFLAKLVQQSLELLTFAVLYAFRLKAWLGVQFSLGDVFQEFSEFGLLTFLVLICWYSGQLSSAIATFFVGLKGTDEEIAAFNAFNSINDYVFQFGNGFAIVGWTFFARLFGEGRVSAARRFSMMFLLGQLFFSAVISAVLWYCSPYLASLFCDSNHKIETYLFTLLRVYCLMLFADFSMNFLFRVTQGLGWTWLTACLNAGLLLGAQSVIASIVTYVCKGGAVALTANLYLMECLAFLVPFALIALSDWQSLAEEQQMMLQAQIDKESEIHPILRSPKGEKQDSPILATSFILGDLTPQVFRLLPKKSRSSLETS